MPPPKIPFNKPYMTGKELDYIREAHSNGHLSGNGPFTKKCRQFLEERLGCHAALLTTSGTAALEMAAILAGIGQGDEVIMPSYTFVSTANAFVMRGAAPVFVDIRKDTFNIDEKLIEGAITPKTKAIVPVHYAGVGCEMDAITKTAKRHGLKVIEDAAMGILAHYKKRPLGAIGHLGSLSFHETKNLICGEGGALLVNDAALADRAHILWEKGTNRISFFKGEVDKYTWVDIGSSYLPSELLAAFLWAQLEKSGEIMKSRLDLWESYYEIFEPLETDGLVRRPVSPEECAHNAHMFYILVENKKTRDRLIEGLGKEGIHAVFHYVPLHSSPAGMKYGRVHGSMSVTDDASDRIVRLPFWVGLQREAQERVAETTRKILSGS